MDSSLFLNRELSWLDVLVAGLHPRAELPAGERLRLAADPISQPAECVERLGTGEDPHPQLGGVGLDAPLSLTLAAEPEAAGFMIGE